MTYIIGIRIRSVAIIVIIDAKVISRLIWIELLDLDFRIDFNICNYPHLFLLNTVLRLLTNVLEFNHWL